jgi:hypothetical protein
MATDLARKLRNLLTRYSAVGLAAAVGLSLGSANAALASNTPAGPQQPMALHVTVVPDQNPVWLAPGLTQSVDPVTIQVSGGSSGYLNICVNHGGSDIPLALTPVTLSHQQIPVVLGQPNTVKVFWAPPPTGAIALSCAHSDEVLVAEYELQVYSAGYVPCVLCVSTTQPNSLSR